MSEWFQKLQADKFISYSLLTLGHDPSSGSIRLQLYLCLVALWVLQMIPANRRYATGRNKDHPPLGNRACPLDPVCSVHLLLPGIPSQPSPPIDHYMCRVGTRRLSRPRRTVSEPGCARTRAQDYPTERRVPCKGCSHALRAPPMKQTTPPGVGGAQRRRWGSIVQHRHTRHVLQNSSTRVYSPVTSRTLPT